MVASGAGTETAEGSFLNMANGHGSQAGVLAALARRQAPLVLAYHGIGDPAVWKLNTSAADFRGHLALLQDFGFDIVAARDVLAGGAGARRCAITFDDCYTNTLAAAEALAAVGGKGTWFAVADACTGVPMWPDRRNMGLSTLTFAQLRDLAAAGMEIGAHTARHTPLAGLDAAALRAETAGAWQTLADGLGEAPVSFCYPYGSYDAAAAEAVAAAGFTQAFTTRDFSARLAPGPFEIPRIMIFGWDKPWRLGWKLALGIERLTPGRMLRGLRSTMVRAPA